MLVLETDRLILRAVIPNDVDDIFEYSNNPNVGPNAGWKPHETKEETKEIMQQLFLDKENIWAIVQKEDNKLIGTIGLIEDPKRENPNVKMLGYAIGESYWGKGITTEAALKVIKYGFEELKLAIISSYCYPFNARSRKVIEKCGFIYEGTLRKAEQIYNGNVYDNVCFSLLAEEYFVKRL